MTAELSGLADGRRRIMSKLLIPAVVAAVVLGVACVIGIGGARDGIVLRVGEGVEGLVLDPLPPRSCPQGCGRDVSKLGVCRIVGYGSAAGRGPLLFEGCGHCMERFFAEAVAAGVSTSTRVQASGRVR